MAHPELEQGLYAPTSNSDPTCLYDDILVGIIPERKLNNGQPSFLASLIAAAAPKPRDHVVHVGAGTIYYTATLAHLVGRRGQLTAIEYEPVLAVRSAQNLAAAKDVRIIRGDGAQVEFASANAILAGAVRPAAC